MSVINAMGSAIYSSLTSGTSVKGLLSGTAAIYHMQAPENTALPFVVFSLQAGGPLNITPSDIRDEVFYVRGYAASMATAGKIDKAISAKLHQGSLTVSGYNNVQTKRESDLNFANTDEAGKITFSAGGLYRITLDD